MTARPANVTLNTILRRSPEATHQIVGNEAVLLDLGSESYFGLNELALRAWEALDDTTSLEQVVNLLASEYDVERTQLEQDILALADQLVQAGLASPASQS